MPDLNSDALGIWEHLKPAIDKEIEQKTRGMVQRRKMKVTTAPSISTGTIGVTEAFGTTEMVIPFATNLISATVGDMVWVEFMYGATNAFASMFASADEKDWDVAGDLSVGGNAGISGDLDVSGSTSLQSTTVNGVLDVTRRRCFATLSSAGWYRAFKINAIGSAAVSFAIDIDITREYSYANNEVHSIKLLAVYNGNVSFVNEQSKTAVLGIDGIRYMVDASGNGYIDVHYALSVSNGTTVDFNAHIRPNIQGWIIAEPLQYVDPSPGTETELARYTFAADTGTPVSFSPTSGSIYRACWYARIGNVCYLHVDMQGLTPLTNTQIFTLPFGYRPLYQTSIQGQGQESYGALASCTVETDGKVSIYSQDHYAIIDGNFICIVQQ